LSCGRGLDLDPNFIEHSPVLQGRLADAGVFDSDADIAFSVGDVCALDFADASFDLASSVRCCSSYPTCAGAA